MWFYNLENYSYIALAFGQRQVLLSLLGFLVMLAVTWSWRRKSIQSFLPAWLWFWVWMLPLSLLGSTNPGVGIFNNTLHWLREQVQRLLPLQARAPCEVPYFDRLSADLPLFPLLSWHKLILLCWLIFSAKKALNLLWQRRRLLAIAKNSAAVNDASIINLLDTLQRSFNLKRAVQLRSSADYAQAFTVGVLRPLIFIPERLLREAALHDIEAVLGHELAHVKRCDDIVICFQLITKSILFFNPLIWLSSWRINSLRERRCDQLAIDIGKLPPQQYAESLLRVAELQRDATFDSSVAAGLMSSALSERVTSILSENERRFSYLPIIFVMTGLLALNVVLMPNRDIFHALRGFEAKILLRSIGAVAPMPALLGDGNFIENVGNSCGLPQRKNYHPGADFIAAPNGDKTVHAIADGEIIMAAVIPQIGTTVQIAHAKNIVSTYVHLHDTPLRVGAHVRAGEPIGTLGDNHLHLEIREDARVIDPSVLVQL